MQNSPEDKGVAAIRRFLAEAAKRPSRRLQRPTPEPEPERIEHPDWFRAAWQEALGGSETKTP